MLNAARINKSNSEVHSSRLSRSGRMKRLLIFGPLLLTGCYSSQMVAFKVNSTPPGAQVDVNGIAMGNTPTTVTLKCGKHWVGYAYSADGYASDTAPYEVTVYPSSAQPGFSQTKRVDPCQWNGANTPELDFNLSLDNVQPVQRIQVK